MRVHAVLVVLRIVDKLRECLPLECVPFAVEQRLPQRLGLLLQLEDVAAVDVRVVVYRRRDVGNRPPFLFPRALVLDLPNAFSLPDARRVHEHLLHPAVPRTARVARAAAAGRDALALLRAQARADELIHVLRKVRQLVKVEPVDLRALVLHQVRPLVVAVAELCHAPVHKPHLVLVAHIPPQRPRHDLQHLRNERLFQLRKRTPEQIRLRSPVLHAPDERIPADRVALPAARRPAVEHLVCRALMEQLLLCRRVIGERHIQKSSSPLWSGMPTSNPGLPAKFTVISCFSSSFTRTPPRSSRSRAAFCWR